MLNCYFCYINEFLKRFSNKKILFYLPLQPLLPVFLIPLFSFMFSSGVTFLLPKGLPFALFVVWVYWWWFLLVLVCLKKSITFIFQGYFLWVHHVSPLPLACTVSNERFTVTFSFVFQYVMCLFFSSLLLRFFSLLLVL